MTDSPEADGAEFARLWTRVMPQIESFVHAVVGAEVDADDLVQETAIACFRAFASYDPRRPFAGWAMGVARNKINDHWRRLGRQPRGVHDPLLLETLAAVQAELGDELDHLRVALRSCIEQVRGRQRDLLERFYQRGQATADIAQDTGLEPGHVSVLLHRLRGSLRKCVERHTGLSWQ